MSDTTGTSGFGLVEVLVALAVASLAVIAVGGLMSGAIAVRERLEIGGRINAVLIDLQVLAQRLGETPDLRIDAPEPGWFQLLGSEAPNTRKFSVFAGERGDARVVEAIDGDRTITVDLSVFGDVGLDYLTSSGGASAWQQQPPTGTTAPLAVRLRLQSGARIWRPLLWMISPSEVTP